MSPKQLGLQRIGIVLVNELNGNLSLTGEIADVYLQGFIVENRSGLITKCCELLDGGFHVGNGITYMMGSQMVYHRFSVFIVVDFIGIPLVLRWNGSYRVTHQNQVQGDDVLWQLQETL